MIECSRFHPLSWWLRHGRRDRIDPHTIVTRKETGSGPIDHMAVLRYIQDPDAPSDGGTPVLLSWVDEGVFVAREGTHRTLAARFAKRRVDARWVTSAEEMRG